MQSLVIRGHGLVANLSVKDQVPIVELLLELGVTVNSADSVVNQTPLFEAVGVGNKEIVKLLLEHKADTSRHDRYGYTPLCIACLQSKTEIALSLIQAGAKVNLRDEDGNLPLHYAAREGNIELVNELLKRGRSKKL